MSIDRRQMLTGAAGTLAMLAFATRPDRGAAAKTPPMMLSAGRRTLDVNGRAASVLGVTQPDGTAGLYTSVDAPFRVVLKNEIGADTLIHWHGLTPPYRQDGVPGISGPPIPPGGSAHYDFPLAFPGTFWMHSHQGLQEQSLLSGPLIIRPKSDPADRQEVVLLLHDFSFRDPQEIFAGLRRAGASSTGRALDAAASMRSMGKAPERRPGLTLPMSGMSMGRTKDAGAAGMVMDLNDVAYDAFLANDRTLADPQIVRVEPGGRILLRVINASASSNFLVDLGPRKASLVAVDGHPVHPLTGSAFPVAMAQRIDLALQLGADDAVVPVFATLEGQRTRTGIVLATANARIRKLTDKAGRVVAPLNFKLERALRAAEPLRSRSADRTHQVDLTGSMGDYVWSLNGRTYGEDEPLMVSKGQRVELVMTNRTMMSHPMHLHGHVFQVVAVGGQRFEGAVRDTVLVPPDTSVTVAFDADNPGRWAFHCHNLYHMAAGMMTTVRYETF